MDNYKMSYDEMLKQLMQLHEDFLAMLKEMRKCEFEEDMSYGKEMGIPPLVDLKSPMNHGKMIPQIGEGYGSLGGINLSVNLIMGENDG